MTDHDPGDHQNVMGRLLQKNAPLTQIRPKRQLCGVNAGNTRR